MGGREVKLKEVYRDIRAGLDDTALMEKYKLSPKGLGDLYAKLEELGLHGSKLLEGDPRSIRIGIRSIVKDIKAGLTDFDLMEKYGITYDALQQLFHKLVELKAVTKEMVFGTVTLDYQPAIPENLRSLQRYYLDFEIPIYERSVPDIHGVLRDITEKGVGIAGLEVAPDDIKSLVILGDSFGAAPPFEFDAICRWFKEEDGDWKNVSGFEITFISERDLKNLRKLIRLITLAELE